jgi:hypothetical protein
MSQKLKDILSKCLLGTIAVSLTLGAAQYALGQDLAGTPQIASASSQAVINRAAKADRVGGTGNVAQTRTIALRFDGLPDTSVLVRMPVAAAIRSNSAPSMVKPGGQKTAVACEPVVSVLTEVAKQLQPGRCVT